LGVQEVDGEVQPKDSSSNQERKSRLSLVIALMWVMTFSEDLFLEFTNETFRV
jgi:hypothetical protein